MEGSVNAAMLTANSRGCDESLYEEDGRRVCAGSADHSAERGTDGRL